MRFHEQRTESTSKNKPDGMPAMHSTRRLQRHSAFDDAWRTQGNFGWSGSAGRLPVVQTKLRVSAPNDRYEQEADRLGDQIAGGRSVDAAAISSVAPGALQRTCSCGGSGECDECRKKKEEGMIQRKSSDNALPASADTVTSAVSGSGRAMSRDVRGFFEERMGTSFDHVRIHDDATAAESARSLNARAYTTGKDIVFGAGEYRPETESGNRLLAHELVHVVQQGGIGRGLVQRKTTPCSGNGRTERQFEHLAIQQDFLKVSPLAQFEYTIPGAGAGGGDGWADIVDMRDHGIYEIKTWLGSDKGKTQLSRYVNGASLHCNQNAGWHRGTNYPAANPAVRVITSVGDRELVATTYPAKADMQGLIIYWWRNKQKERQPVPVPHPVVGPKPINERKPVSETGPQPVSSPPHLNPQPAVPQPGMLHQITDFIQKLAESGEDVDQACRRFLTQHPEIKNYILAIGATILIGTIIEDLATFGAGIIDDLVTIPIGYRLMALALQ